MDGVNVSPREFPQPALDGGASGDEGIAVLAGGCFWCVEAVLQKLIGVLEVTSGYAGGTAETANYRAVCSGATAHAEATRVRFDPSKISFGEVLRVFFSVAHDPTQVDRQGADVGRQYRSAIFYADEEQKRVAEAYIRQLTEAKIFNAPIATTLEPLEEFFEAEAYHQNYANENPMQPYVACNVPPKLEKLREYFGELIDAS